MFACESRRIEILRTDPGPTCISIIESERAGPPEPGSLLSGGLASDPRTRTVLPVRSEPPGESAALAVSDECSANCADTRKTTNERAIHATTASSTHLTTRPHENGLRTRRGLGLRLR